MIEKVTLLINNISYEGWKSIQIARNLESLSGSFEFSLTDKWRENLDPWVFKPNDNIVVKVGSEIIITGFIDSLAPRFTPKDREMIVFGRDKAGDLVDSSNVFLGDHKNLTILQLAKKFIDPFDIEITADVSVGSKISKFTVEPGETVFESLQKLARLKGLLIISEPSGNLKITTNAETNAGTSLVQGKNVISGGGRYDNTSRFKEYFVYGQDTGSDDSFGDQVSEIWGKAQDDGITRNRPLIIREDKLNSEEADKRAQWEATVRAANATVARIQVQDWRKANGDLWTINELVNVDCGFLGLRLEMLISGVVFNKSGSGTITDLQLVRKDSFKPASVLKKVDDPTDFLGWDK